jgi:PAS domain S-box-containing protein
LPSQILTLKSGGTVLPVTRGEDGEASAAAAVVPSRWLLARHGGGDERWVAVGMAGFSPFEAVTKVGIQLPSPSPSPSAPWALQSPAGQGLTATVNGATAVDAAALKQAEKDKERLLRELAEARESVNRLQMELRTLREAEHTLIRRERQQQSVMEALPGGLLLLDEHGAPLFQSAHLKSLFGRAIARHETVEDWLGQACPDETHRAEVSRIWREDVWRRQLTRTVSLVTTDGLLKEIELRPASLDRNGLMVHFQDVTGFCRLEEQLSATESKCRSLFHENPLAILIADKSGTVYDVNRAAEELFQQSKAALRRLPVEDLLSPASAALRKDALREMRQSGESRKRLSVHLAGEDAPKMNLTVASIRAANGEPHSTVHFFETPVTWAAPVAGFGADTVAPTGPVAGALEVAALPPAPETAQRAAAAPPVLLLATNVHGRVRRWTEAAQALFGYPENEVLGQPLHLLFQPSNASGFYSAALPDAVRAGEVEWAFFGRDGQRGTVSCRVQAGEQGASEVELWQVVEAAPEPVAAARAQDADSGSAEWGSGVALPSRPEWAMTDLTREQAILSEAHHRINHHLTILSSLLHAQSNEVADSGAREALRSTQNRLQAVAALHQHLEKASLRTGADIETFVSGLVSHLRNSLEVSDERVRVEVAVPAELELPNEWLMPLALTLNETLSNALEHGFPEGRSGKVSVQLEVEGSRARLVIADNGIGMSSEPKAAAERGMGLKIVAVFADQMRSQLKILGSPEQGTTIEMQFFIAFADN